jgi:protein TonB
MLRIDKMFPYLIVSIFLHIAVYFLFHSKENPVFLSSPIEVSFYSLPSQRVEQSSAAVSSKKAGATMVASVWKQIKNNDTKEDVVVKNPSPEKKADEQFAKPIGEKKEGSIGFSGNTDNVGTFKVLDFDKLLAGAGSQYEGLSFDTKNFKYSYYTGQIIRKIWGQWRWGGNYGKLRVLVYFKICRNGTVHDVSVRESSGSGEYDKYALDTICRAAPFPDLPDGYEGDSLGVFFEFKY